MKTGKFLTALVCAAATSAAALPAAAFNIKDGVAVHGSVQTSFLFPENDEEINTDPVDEKILFNTYADFSLASKFVDAGFRFEFMKWPLPGYEKDFAGWGVPNIYVKGKFKGIELTAGDFYEQFGSGFILRTYEDRPLGIDNSLRGGRLKINSIKGMRLTLLGGLQRRYWDWSKHSQVYGADLELYMEDYMSALRNHNATWMIGGSYVLKHEDEAITKIDGTDFGVKLPKFVNAIDARSRFNKGAFSVLGEFAWKGQDPSFDNDYTYGTGTAYMLSGSFSKKGISALLQVKRSENMSFRSQREMGGTSAMLNNLPAFSYQHTYALASLYPYATQAADGEWAFQGAFSYTFKRKTPLGGRYGTKIYLNASYIRGLDRKAPQNPVAKYPDGQQVELDTQLGTNGYTSSFFGMGENFYQDFNIQIEKKLTPNFQMSFMYMNQLYNKTVVEGEGGNVRSNIFVLDGKYKFNKRITLRGELQYLTTRQDQKDWAYGLLELTVLPYLMFTVSDMWNCGETGTHYYMAGITGNYRANQLMLSYGRTREGFNCSGGVCRKVPAYHGFQIAYSYYF